MKSGVPWKWFSFVFCIVSLVSGLSLYVINVSGAADDLETDKIIGETTAETYTISGQITNLNGDPLPGLVVSALGNKIYLPLLIKVGAGLNVVRLADGSNSTAALTPTAFSVVTDSNGEFVIAGLPAGDYQIVPTMEGVTFVVSTVSVPPTADGVNFTAVPSAAEGNVLVPEGSFPMGCHPDHNGGEPCEAFELPLHTVFLDTYQIEKQEVTNSDYAAFLNDRASGNICYGNVCIDYADYGSRLDYVNGEFVVRSGYENHPVTEVTWYGADTYCREKGGNLPTEAQWEKAARGTSLRTYPWGDTAWSCNRANGDQSCVGGTTAVGRYPTGISPYGVMDMAGNVFEWVKDTFDSDYYSISPTDNPLGPTNGSNKVLRGGAWTGIPYYLRTAARTSAIPTSSWHHVGFRCAFPPVTAPYLPYAADPPHEAVSEETNSILVWEGGDPNGQEVQYDVYFGTNPVPDQRLCDNTSYLFCNPGALAPHTTYYWQVVASNGEVTHGPIWQFTTGDTTPLPREMVSVPAGEFQMGCDPNHNGGHSCQPDNLPLRNVYLDAFEIDKYPVTNREYVYFLNTRQSNDCDGQLCIDLSNGFQHITLIDGVIYVVEPGYENHPAIPITWYGADVYCRTRGDRLPTEAEWEKAARGTTARAFPWGDADPTCALANFASSAGSCVGDTDAVFNYPGGASPYGVMDMAGNAMDWTNDWYDPNYYQGAPTQNPTGPAVGTVKVVRGGGFEIDDWGILTSYRNDAIPGSGFAGNGFRCAATVDD